MAISGSSLDVNSIVTQLMIAITLVNQDVTTFGLKAMRVAMLIGGTRDSSA